MTSFQGICVVAVLFHQMSWQKELQRQLRGDTIDLCGMSPRVCDCVCVYVCVCVCRHVPAAERTREKAGTRRPWALGARAQTAVAAHEQCPMCTVRACGGLRDSRPPRGRKYGAVARSGMEWG